MNYLILDTETACDIDSPICYDMGWCIVNDKKEILQTRSYVVAEIFLDKELMSSAYYNKKIPRYIEDIDNGSRELRKLNTIRLILAKDIAKFHIDFIIAHNARFDYKACQNTQRYLTSSKFRWFFPYNMKFVDTLKMARYSFKNDKEYLTFCKENNFLCANGRPRFTAEVLTRFLTKNLEFDESHTGLEDCLIEKDIFFKCLEMGCEPLFLWE